jgi:hypothetical protein
VKENNRKGRKAGISYKKETGYIMVTDKIRIRVETDNLIVEELQGINDWGNNHYFTSWKGIMDWIIRRFTTEKISQQEIWSFTDARKEIVLAIEEVKKILFGEIDKAIKIANSEIKESIVKFNR